jgi:hypothetical protein
MTTMVFVIKRATGADSEQGRVAFCLDAPCPSPEEVVFPEATAEVPFVDRWFDS